MKEIYTFLAVCLILLSGSATAYSQQKISLFPVLTFNVGQHVGKLRAVPVNLSRDEQGLLLIYSADKEIDPYIEMFYPPSDRMKLAMYSKEGKLLWRKELGGGVINGIWFTPVYPFDLNNDGKDEIYFVNNIDSIHILSYQNRRLEALDALTGETTGQWPWKKSNSGSLSQTFRFFIMGGYSGKVPVLVTAQGTYGSMGLQGWTEGMKQRWDLFIDADEAGARGSHMCPVVDINNDGIDELLWGERCISIADGKYLFIADKDLYKGHSDVIQPTLNRKDNRWYIFTCRESGDKGQIKPRVVMFDDTGKRVWYDLDLGHMDMGWTAQTGLDGEALAFTISRGEKVAGPSGFFRNDVVEYAYDAYTGKRIKLPFQAYNTVPVDLNGDGLHEFVSAQGEQSDRYVYSIDGQKLAFLGETAYVAMASKFLDLPGEQIICYYPDGTIKIWADKNAKDNSRARKRYANPYYKQCQRLTATGYNLVGLGGL